MANLIDLSRMMRIRAEVLRKVIQKAGMGDYAPDQNLPLEVEKFLLDQQKPSRFKKFLRKLQPFSFKRFSPLRLFQKKTDLESSEVFTEETGIQDETPIPLDRIELPEPLESEEAPVRLEAESLEPTGLEEASEQEDLAESTHLLLEALDTSSSLATPDSAPVSTPPPRAVPPPEPIAANGLLSSLAALEPLRDGSELPVLHYQEPEFRAEEELQQPPIKPSEVFPQLDTDFEFLTKPTREEFSSTQLQAMVDELAHGIPDLDTVIVPKTPPLWRRLTTLVPRIELTLKEKALVGMGVALASALIASSLYLRSVNYGPGGDEKFYQVGLQQEKERDLNAALESFAKVTQRYPRSPRAPQAHRKMSEVYHKKGDLTKASQALRESLWSQSHLVSHATHEWNQDEKNFRWQNHFMLGEISMAEKAWGTASDWYQQLIDENASPSIFQKALYRYGDALYQKSDKAERNSIEMRDLIEAYERAIEASPEAKWNAPSLFRLAELWEDLAGHEVGFRKENLGKALDYMKRLEQKGERLPLEGIDPLKVQLSMGRLYRDLGEVESSIGLYRGLLAQPKDPLEDTPLPLDVMGGLARSLLTRAEQYAKEAQSASAETDLYEVLEISRAFDEEQPTKRTSEQSDETAPIGIVESLYLRGHANYQLGVLKAGQTDKGPNGYFEKMDLAYQAALARNDHYGLRGIDSLLAMLRRTNFEFQINQDYHAAVRAYTRILEQFPASIYAYRIRHRLGTAQFHLGEYAEAEVQFRQVVDQFSLTRYVDDQAFRDSYFRLGHCQFLMKEYLRAADTIKTLLQLIDYEETPEALSAWRLLAEAYYSQGLYDQAIEEYRNYLTRYPAQDQEGKIRLALGRTLISRFDYEEGRKELQKIIDQQSEGRATSALYQSARMARYFICESYLTEFNLAPGNSRGALLSKALYEANNLRSAFPAEDTPLHLLGRVHFLMGDFERAVRDLEYFCNSAQGQRPLATAQLLLGESYFNLKRYNKAAEVLARLEVSELPREEGARTLYLLAESQRFEKQFQNAADTYNRLAKDYPASTYSELVQGRIEEVLWRLRKGI